MSSKFRSNIPHRATPQTCYPPPPPPIDPGYIPCLGRDWGQFASISGRVQIFDPSHPVTPIDLGPVTNMATARVAPGIREWQATLTGGGLLELTLGIRCVTEVYHAPRWQTRAAGAIVLPDGRTTRGTGRWFNNLFVSVTDDGHAVSVHFSPLYPIGWATHPYLLGPFGGTLTQRSDTSRSRPPHPPIPSLA